MAQKVLVKIANLELRVRLGLRMLVTWPVNHNARESERYSFGVTLDWPSEEDVITKQKKYIKDTAGGIAKRYGLGYNQDLTWATGGTMVLYVGIR